MKIKSNVKAGRLDDPSPGGGRSLNHNQKVARSMKLKSGVKAGLVAPDI